MPWYAALNAIKSQGHNKFQEGCSTHEAIFRFSNPQFCLQLDLKHPNDDSMNLSVIWAFWWCYSERARNSPSLTAQGLRAETKIVQTRSIFIFKPPAWCTSVLTSLAIQCLRKVDAAASPSYVVAWSHYYPPISFTGSIYPELEVLIEEFSWSKAGSQILS